MNDQSPATLEEIKDSTRLSIRVLFISDDESLLQSNQQSLDGYLQLGSVFDEVHIMVLRTGASSPFPVLRVSHNTWLYTVSTDTWWWAPVPAMALVKNQLVFNGDFRPDLIVARDPFASGVLAHWLAKKYQRAVQVHVTEDFTSERFANKNTQPRWRRIMANWVLNRTKSVRVPNQSLQKFIQTHCPLITDVSVLPRFNNYSQLKELPIIVDVREKYPQFKFTYLFVGELSHDSSLPVVLNAMRGILQNQSVGLLVVGEGRARAEYQALCQRFGLERQVVFTTDTTATISYLKTVSVVVVTDETPEADEVALQAAAVGTPAVMTETPARQPVFVDGESALFVSLENRQQLQFQLSAVLNDLLLRRNLHAGVAELLTDTLHEDRDVYRTAYKQSIESALLTIDREDAKL